MRLYEFEGAELFRREGIPVPDSALASNPEESRDRAQDIGLPVVIKAQVLYAVEDEMALTLEDFMGRRTSLIYFNGDPKLASAAAKLMGDQLGWSRARRRAEIRGYRKTVEDMFYFRRKA